MPPDRAEDSPSAAEPANSPHPAGEPRRPRAAGGSAQVEPTDEARRVAGEDVDAGFAAALTGAEGVVRGFLRRFVRGADLDDLAQETLTRAWRYRDGFTPEADPHPWLRRCALRAWLAWRERRDGQPIALGDQSAAIHEPRRPVIEARDDLRTALAPLRPIERELLLRHHRDRCRVRELATEFGMSENTVKSHLRRARARLARIDDDT